MANTYFVYIITNNNNSVIYIGVTNNLHRRLYEHQKQIFEGFSRKYNVHKLVYFETTSDIKSAIAREKQLKKWSRAKKNALVEKSNPSWEEIIID